MWILGRSCDEPRLALQIELPSGAYFAPRNYDTARLAVLARLLCDCGSKVRDTVSMTWKQADTLEALGRVRGDGHRSDALWALHGDAGVSLPPGGTELKALIARRFPAMQPRWVIILDAEAPASALGWLEAHVKMPLVSWLGRLLGDPRHPLHAAGVDRIDVQALATMTSDPLETMEIVEKAVEHRLTHAFPAGIPRETVVSGPVNVEDFDWSRSLRVAAAQRLASRVNQLAPDARSSAARLLLRLELGAEQREQAVAELVRAGLMVPASAASDGRLALARAVLEDEDGRIVFQDALDLSEEDRRRIGAWVMFGQGGKATIIPPTQLANFARTLYRTGADPSRPAQLYESALAAEPSNSDILESYATFLLTTRRDPNRAQEYYERALVADPRNALALANFAGLYLERRDLDRAQGLYERALEAGPKNAQVLIDFATFLRVERRDLDRAQELYERAIVADPKNMNALNGFAAFVREERRDLGRAQELYERALIADPKDVMTLDNFATFLRVERRDFDRAQELYERAFEAAPGDLTNLNDFATFLRIDRRDLDRAQKLYELMIGLDATNAAVLTNFANFLREDRRDLDRSQELYERAVAADPTNANVLNNFAIFLNDERRDFHRAQALCERALASDPKSPNVLANLAHILFLAGRRLDAIEYLREAITYADAKPLSLMPALASELSFYRTVHIPEERGDALRELRTLVAQGARSPGWNFRAHAVLADKASDADAPLFLALADVLSGKADAATLASFPRWTQASPVVDKE